MAAMLGFWIAYRHADPASQAWFRDPNLTGLASIIEVSMVVMFASWIGALVRLAKLRQWTWFAAVLLTQLLGAGIAGMVSYAGSGPDDAEVAQRRVRGLDGG